MIMHELSVSVPLDFRPLYCIPHLRTRFTGVHSEKATTKKHLCLG